MQIIKIIRSLLWKSYRIKFSNFRVPGWDNIEIVKIFKNKFEVPVYLQNDASACALAEWRFGAGMGSSNMIFLTLETLVIKGLPCVVSNA